VLLIFRIVFIFDHVPCPHIRYFQV